MNEDDEFDTDIFDKFFDPERVEEIEEEYFDSDDRWGEHIPASEEEARDEWNARIDRTWEMWFHQVAKNYPECEKAEGYA